MNAIALLFVAGTLLLGFEVFVPGGILGLAGAGALLGGIVLAFVDFGASGGWSAVAIAAVLVGLILFFEFRILPHTPMGRRMFLRAAIDGTSQSPEAAGWTALVGCTGETLTPLAPSGYVAIDGRRYEAFSRSGLLPKGAAVRVAEVDNFRLIVTKT